MEPSHTRHIRIGCSGWQYRFLTHILYQLPPNFPINLERFEIFLRALPRGYRRIVVGPFIYVRFHHGTRRYGGRYSDERLDSWGAWLAVRLRERIHQRVAA